MARTINVAGPFFLDLGVNGRRCSTCHEPQSNMTVTPARLRARFDATEGNDPIFRPNDGSNSPLADTSTVEARRTGYSMLLTKGLIRIGLPIPVTAEFELVSVQDPYGYAGRNANGDELSLFRRPAPGSQEPLPQRGPPRRQPTHTTPEGGPNRQPESALRTGR